MTYYTVWKLFNKFYLRLDNKPDTWEKRLVLFVAYLIDGKRQSSTVKSYISAIKDVLKSLGVKINQDECLLTSLTRACKLNNNTVNTRLPICRGMLDIILKKVNSYFNDQQQPYLACLYTTLLSTAYFGLFRVGELTMGDHPVLAKDVQIGFNKWKILFILRMSKTHWKNSPPELVKISSQEINQKLTKRRQGQYQKSKEFCPYTLLRNYASMRGPYSSDSEPFFVFSDGSPVWPRNLRACLKKFLKLSRFSPSSYSLHSLRAGRTVDLWKCGLSVETIKKLGRWRFNAVFKYLKCFWFHCRTNPSDLRCLVHRRAFSKGDIQWTARNHQRSSAEQTQQGPENALHGRIL